MTFQCYLFFNVFTVSENSANNELNPVIKLSLHFFKLLLFFYQSTLYIVQ